jgi:hypothetical protein
MGSNSRLAAWGAPRDVRAYLTDKPVVALPFDPALLDRLIDERHVSYLLTSNEYRVEYKSPIASLYTSRLVTRYIFEHPERYRLVKSWHEDYPAICDPPDYDVFQALPRA